MNRQEIENVEFKVTRLKEGYDQGEVDDFLDKVWTYVTTLEDCINEEQTKVRNLTRELAEANRILAAYGEEPTRVTPAAPVSASAAKILEAAQRTADNVIDLAHSEAHDIKAEARGEANKLVAEAGQEADAKRQAAEAHAYHAEKKLKELREKHETLRTFLVQHLETGLDSLNDAPEISGA